MDIFTLPADGPMHLVRGDALDLTGWCGPCLVSRPDEPQALASLIPWEQDEYLWAAFAEERWGLFRVQTDWLCFDLSRPEVRHLVRDRIPGLAYTAALPEWQAVAILGASVRRVQAGEEPLAGIYLGWMEDAPEYLRGFVHLRGGEFQPFKAPDFLALLASGFAILIPDESAILVPIEGARVVRVQAPPTTTESK